MNRLDRRTFLLGSLAGGLGAAGAVAAPGLASAATGAGSRRLADPFTLGVASGDPTPDGVVLWTRLAPRPLAGDGRGGMPARPVTVEWQLAEDPRLRRGVRTGSVAARPEAAHSVHVEVGGLVPDRDYYFRFRTAGHLSDVARTRTAPAAGSGTPLLMAVASCAQYEHGYFTAYRHLAEDSPDVVLHLGDYFYEYPADTYVADGSNVRDHAGPETVTLANYRQRHAQYKTDLDLQAAHAAAPWIPVWDDHELDNNWADEVPEDDQGRAAFRARRKAAFRAYYENMPLRRSSVPRGIDMQIYRRVAWGRTAMLHMLDTRQFRSDQACGDGAQADCEERLDRSRTITGEQQERWLLDGFARSRATWDVLGQQVFFAQRDFAEGPVKLLSMDAWDGYVASRERILRGAAERGVRNGVVLTGDVHRHYANDLKVDFDDPDSATIGVELVTTSITSNGDGSDRTDETDAQLRENPHIAFASTQRGYVRALFTAEQMRADFRVVPYVQQPNAPVSTRASFVVEAGRPGLQRV